MTRDERRNPACIKQQVTRQRRIARGSGRDISEVRDLVDRYDMMKALLGQLNMSNGGFLSRIPGFKQLGALNRMKNSGMGDIFNAMSGMQGGPGGLGGLGGMGGFPGMGGTQQPQLPRGFNAPGGARAAGESTATKAQIDREKERRKKQAARKARKGRR